MKTFTLCQIGMEEMLKKNGKKTGSNIIGEYVLNYLGILQNH